MKTRLLIAGILTGTLASTLPAQVDGHRPDGHAPIGVMGDHVHKEGEFMISYRFQSMLMDGNRDGTSSLSTADVLARGYMVAPTEMTMEMHMLGGMWAFSDDVTLMAMLPYVRKSMDHFNGMTGKTFTTRSEGLGDVKVTGLIPLSETPGQRWHLNAGLSLPTGSIDETDDTPMGPDQPLPYPMQLGSGTWDLRPGVTWNAQRGDYSWGGQVQATIRTGENDRDYRFGNVYELDLWGARRWSSWISSSLRLAGSLWGDVHGADPALNPAMVPTADPDLRGGRRVDLGLGVNLYVPEGDLHDARLAAEVLIPLFQDLDGPQLETDLSLVLGFQYTF